MTPKQSIRIGIFYVEEAILDTLSNVEELSQTEISRSVGTHKTWKYSGWLVASLLRKLEREKRICVTKRSPSGKARAWALTETESKHRIENAE